MNLLIFVEWQVDPKVVPAAAVVDCNRVIDVRRTASEHLRAGAEFLWAGAWYTVRRVEVCP